MTDQLLVATDVVAGYLPGVDILRGMSLDMARGELVGIIGPNGAGKSTFVKAVFGLVEVRDGTGRMIHKDLSRAGSSLELRGEPPFKILLGYAHGVELRYNGDNVAIAPHTRNNVADFVNNLEGSSYFQDVRLRTLGDTGDAENFYISLAFRPTMAARIDEPAAAAGGGN